MFRISSNIHFDHYLNHDKATGNLSELGWALLTFRKRPRDGHPKSCYTYSVLFMRVMDSYPSHDFNPVVMFNDIYHMQYICECSPKCI